MTKVLKISLFIYLAWAGNTLRANPWPVLDSLNNAFHNATTDSSRIVVLFNVLESLNYDNVDTSLLISEKLEELAQRQSDTVSLIKVASQIARLHLVQGGYREALKSDQRVYAYATAINDTKNAADALNRMGEAYLGLGLFNDAYINYQAAIEKSEEIHDSLMVAIATYNLGRLFKATGQWTEALGYIRRSMALSEQIDDKLGEAYSLHDLSEIYLEQGDTSKMLKSLQTALSVAEEADDDIIKPQILTKTAEFYCIKNELVRALDYYDMAFNIYKNQSNITAMASVDLGRAKIAMRSGQNQKARNYYEGALKVARTYADGKLLMNTYDGLATFYERQGNFKQSLDLFRKSQFMEDSMRLANRNEAFANTQMEYQMAKKDRAIQALNQKEQERQLQLKNEEFLRNVLVIILAFVGLLLITLYTNNVKRRHANQILVKHQKEIEDKSHQLEKLLSMKDKFFSIVSHDLRSPINALTGLLDMLDKDNLTHDELVNVTKPLKKRLSSTSKMLDNLLDWAMMEMDEIKIHEQAISLIEVVQENFAFFHESNQKNIQFLHNLPDDIMLSGDKNMLDLIIRNLISNAIKFSVEGGEIRIDADNTDEQMVTISIQDNGVGMNKDQLDRLFDSKILYTTRGTANERGTGLGLKLCKEFVEKMGGKIWVESKEGMGSTFKFTVKRSDPPDEGGEMDDILPGI